MDDYVRGGVVVERERKRRGCFGGGKGQLKGQLSFSELPGAAPLKSLGPAPFEFRYRLVISGEVQGPNYSIPNIGGDCFHLTGNSQRW